MASLNEDKLLLLKVTYCSVFSLNEEKFINLRILEFTHCSDKAERKQVAPLKSYTQYSGQSTLLLLLKANKHSTGQCDESKLPLLKVTHYSLLHFPIRTFFLIHACLSPFPKSITVDKH